MPSRSCYNLCPFSLEIHVIYVFVSDDVIGGGLCFTCVVKHWQNLFFHGILNKLDVKTETCTSSIPSSINNPKDIWLSLVSLCYITLSDHIHFQIS